MTWMFGDERDRTLPVQATVLMMKNLKLIQTRFKRQRHLGHSLAALICLALLVVCQTQAAGPEAATLDDLSKDWETPFTEKLYLVHSPGYTDKTGVSVLEDKWFLSPRKPINGSLVLPWIYGKYSIDKLQGPFDTYRAVCACANGMSGPAIEIYVHSLAPLPFSCKDITTQPSGTNKPEEGPCANACDKSKHLIWDGYAGCSCICEDGWKFDEHGDCMLFAENETEAAMEAELTLELETNEGTKVIKTGDRTQISLAAGDKAKVIAICKAIIADLATFDILMGLTNETSVELDNVFKLGLLYQGLDCKKLLRSAGIGKVFEDGSIASSSDLAGGQPMKIELDLQRGPLGIEVSQDIVAIDVDTPTAIVSSTGKNKFGVAYNPEIGRTVVTALRYPVTVHPTSGNQAPFTLAAGQQVEVSSEGVGAVIPINQTSNNGTAPGSRAAGVPGAGNATAGNATSGGEGISAPGGPGAPGASSTGTSTGGALSPSGNNQIGDAADISAGQSVRQTISPAGSSNFYRFRADSSGIVKLKLENVPKDMRPYLCLYDKNLAPISEKSASNAGDVLNLEKDVQGPGWFYIEARDIDGKAHSEPYTLDVAFEPAPDQYEPNPNYFRATDVKSGEDINAYRLLLR